MGILAACFGGWLLLASSARANLITNGGFELPPGVYPYMVFSGGLRLPGWTIESGTVEIVGTYWQAAEGSQSLDLNGIFEEIGTIYQDIATVPGERYKIRFAYAGNPECGPVVKTTKVFWNDEELATVSFDTTGHSFTNMRWTYYEYEVTTSKAASRLRFQSTTSSFCGPTLDDISVAPVNEPPPPPPPPPPTNVVTVVNNGSFEIPGGVYPYQVFGYGFNLPGWTIESGTVEIVGTYWQAAEGNQSLDLNGIFEEIGTIYQDIATVPGQRYKVRFAYAGNPECGPVVKTTKVFWCGEELATVSFDTTGHGFENMGWTYYEYEVTASGTTSRLRFQSTTSSFCGSTLDNVSVTAIPPGDQPPAPFPPLNPPPWVGLGLGQKSAPDHPRLRRSCLSDRMFDGSCRRNVAGGNEHHPAPKPICLA
jgi:choice-of-anchor C domain-containing protein